MSCQEVGFFSPIYSNPSVTASVEKASMLGRIIEPLFDFGQTSYEILMKKSAAQKIYVMEAEPQKGMHVLALRIVKAVVLIFAALSVVGISILLAAKFYYREINNFQIQNRVMTQKDLDQLKSELEKFKLGSEGYFQAQTKINNLEALANKEDSNNSCDFLNYLNFAQDLRESYEDWLKKAESLSLFFDLDKLKEINDLISDFEILNIQLSEKINSCREAVIEKIKSVQEQIKDFDKDALKQDPDREKLVTAKVKDLLNIANFLEDFGDNLELTRHELTWFFEGVPLIDNEFTKMLHGILQPKGISNLGASCYLNSSLQLLFSSETIRDKIAEPNWASIETVLDNFILEANARDVHLFDDKEQLRETWAALKEEEIDFYVHLKSVGDLEEDGLESLDEEMSRILKNAILDYQRLHRLKRSLQEYYDELENPATSPYALSRKVVPIRDALFKAQVIAGDITEQQDAQESLNYILTALGLGVSLSTERSGERDGRTIRSNKETSFYSNIPLIIPDQKEPISIQSLIDGFFTEKKAGSATDTWNNFSSYQEKMSLEGNPPKVINLHLKRFSFNMRTGYAHKIKTPLIWDSDFEIDFSKAFNTNQECRYKLKAIVNHKGDVGGGHYTASLKQANIYFDCNDSVTKPVDVSDFAQKAPYGYFYLLEKVD